MEEKEEQKYCGTLSIRNREEICVDKVHAILFVDEECIRLETDLGEVEIVGSALKVESLTKNEEKIYAVGAISSVTFHDGKPKKRGSFFAK